MKKAIHVCLVLLLAALLTLPVSAGGAVTYDGNAQQFIFAAGSNYSPTDLFSAFKDVMPGDTLTQTVTVKNDSSRNVKVKLYLRALGAHEESTAFLSELGLTVQKRSTAAYMFDAAADATDGLTDWVYLGTLYSGGEVDLDVTLKVPVTLDNVFQDAVGYLDWEFKAEEFPVEDSDPKPPQTGERVRYGVYAALACSAAVLVVLLRKPKKETTAER